jgi:hypothetical protein
MATYVLIHGAGSDSWYWHLVTPLLRAHGHDAAMARGEREQSGTAFVVPWPRAA